MQLKLNGQEVDYELEAPLGISEFISQVQDNLSAENLYILDYGFRKKEGVESPKTTDDIEMLDIIAGNKEHLLMSTLESLDNYLDRAGTFLVSKLDGSELSGEESEQYNEGVRFIREVVQSVNPDPDKRPERLDQALITLSQSPHQEARINALAVVKNQVAIWKKLLSVQMLGKEEQARQKQEFMDAIEEKSGLLEKSAMLLTQGKEAESLATVSTFMDYLTKGIALFNHERGKEEIIQTLVRFLEDLTRALDRRDLVTAADILDFDLRDALATLRD